MQRLKKYEIVEEIGRGSFGVVYRGRDETLDREVALKVLHPQLSTDRDFARRFRREARILARLRHSNIVRVYEVGEAEGQLYIAMELACGASLDAALAERGHIPWEETLALLEPVCRALDYAHGRGVVHRDLKPSNILLDEECGPLLADFGIARLVGSSSAALTMTGGIVGTPAYIAPEVWETGEAQAPADIYALGCIAYEMLTGEVLFFGSSPMQAMRAHDRGPQFPARWPEGVSEGVARVLGRALARAPGDRFASAVEMVEALKQVTGQRRREGPIKAPSAVFSPTQPFEPEMIRVPAGTFLMGSDPSQDSNARDSEQPQHELYLPDYTIGRTPVTEAQYLAFVRATSHGMPPHWGKGAPPSGKEKHPVANVSWGDAVAYCAWLVEATGRPYRLPTEAEWEKAASWDPNARQKRRYPWGDRWDHALCNTKESGVGHTTPVGRYSPGGDSPYGCADMAGNVWEWTSGLFAPYPYDAADGREDPEAGADRVVRGGSFNLYRNFVRCAYRVGYLPGYVWYDFGFRVVVSPISPPLASDTRRSAR